MKKKIAVIATALFVFASIEAFSFGIGVRGGGGIGGSGGGGLLLSPKPGLHWHFGVNYYFGSGVSSIGGTGDYWLIEKKLTSAGSGSLDFYAGAGLFTWLGFYKDLRASLGVRIPVGLDLDFKVVDIFIEAVPQLGLSLLPSIELDSSWLGGAIGIRVWIG
jgi:hypothetical protein